MAEELGAAMDAASGSSLSTGHPWLLWGGCSHWPHLSRRVGTYCICQLSKITVPTTFMLCWEGLTKLTGSLGTFFQALPGPVTQVAASALLLCPRWLPALVLLGSGVWDMVPGFVTSGLSKPCPLSKSWLWGDCCGTQELASCSQELKLRGFLSAKLLSCTSWDTQGPAPWLPQPVSYSVSWELHPSSSCADLPCP